MSAMFVFGSLRSRAAFTLASCVMLLRGGSASLAAVSSNLPQLPAIQPDFDLNPIYSTMPLQRRLDYRAMFENKTGGTITFVGGKATFLDAEGQVLRVAPLDAEQFAERAGLSDSAFVNGRGVTDLPNLTADAMADLRVTIDGRIWAVGSGLDATDTPRVVVARFLQDGRPDTSFDGTNNANGLIVTPFAGSPQALVVDDFSRLTLVGTVPSSGQILVGRFLGNGAADASFNGSGIRQFTVGNYAAGRTVALDDLGRVLVGGYAVSGGTAKAFVARLTSTGTLDSKFGTGGIVILEVPGASASLGQAIQLDAADRVVLVGSAIVGGKPRYLLARLGEDGSPDGKFGGDGFATAVLPGHDRSEASALILTGSGRLLVAGSARNGGGGSVFALARFEDDGTPDAGFAGDGFLTFGFPGFESSEAGALVVDLFGRALLAGKAYDGSQAAMAVARVEGNGSLDTSFSADGRRTLGGFGSGQEARAAGLGVLYTGDIGDVIVGGTATVWVKNPAKEDDARWGLARLDFNGALNPGATIRNGSTVTLDLLDFPFTANDPAPPFDGFDPRATPDRVDLELTFKEVATPLALTGARPAAFVQNARQLRFPLRDWFGPELYSLKVSQSHHFGQNHVGNPSQRYALDLVMVNLADPNQSSLRPDVDVPALIEKYKKHPNFDPAAEYAARHFNEAHLLYGRDVHAVADGQVVFAVNTDDENWPVGTRNPKAGGGGNSVIVNHGKGELSFYAHMIKGSVQVKAGDFVTQGQVLGRAGNSGSSSGPHLHFHVMRTYHVDDGHGLAVPTYFVDLRFPSSPGGAIRRQWRGELPNGQVFSVLDDPFTATGPGLEHGPGKLGAVFAPNDLGGSVPVLVLPAQVTGTVDRNNGAHVADEGDGLEEVYAFKVPSKGTVSVKLSHAAERDLDFVIYDRNFRVRKPMLGRTRNQPEKGSLTLSAGTYFLFVTEHDRVTSRGPVQYTLDVSFHRPPPIVPKLTAAPRPTAAGTLRLELPLATHVDGDPVALLLPAVQKVRDFSTLRWETVETRVQTLSTGVVIDLPVSTSETATFYRLVFEDEEP